MTKPTAFKATYADFKLIKTRGVVQVVLEVPLAESDTAYQVLGGMPNPAKETWFGIAALKSEERQVVQHSGTKPEHKTQPGADKPLPRRAPVAANKKLAQQAGIACSDPVFWKFIREHCCWDCDVEGDAADYVRKVCAVDSRVEIIPGSKAAERWSAMHSDFLLWRDNPDLETPVSSKLERDWHFE